MSSELSTDGWTDELIGAGIAKILSWGIFAAVVIVLLGSATYLWQHGLEPFKNGRVPGENLPLGTMTEVLAAALRLDGRALIQLGLVVLIATPIARVAFSVYAFAKQRDRAYLIITTTVLAVLCYSLLAS